MDPSRSYLVKDHILRPWTANDTFDDLIKEECYELDKANRRTAPYKNAGDYGLSSLDRPPAEMIEIEKLLLNFGSYPVINKQHPSSAKNSNRKRTADIEQHSPIGSITPPMKHEYHDNQNGNNRVHLHLNELESGLKQVYEDYQKNDKQTVKRFESTSAKFPQETVYGNSRRKASMKSVTYKTSKGAVLTETNTESFHKFLQKQVNFEKSYVIYHF